MSAHDLVHELKVKQDAVDAQKKELLDVYLSFRGGFVEELELFAKEAVRKGLQGVKSCTRRQDTDKMIVLAFALNHFDLILIAGDTVALRSSQDNAPLASKMFVFSDQGDEDSTLLAMIEIWQSGEAYSYSMSWFTIEGHTKEYMSDNTVGKHQGQQVAQALIRWFYDDTRWCWLERPALERLLPRDVRERPLGFQHVGG